MLRLNLSSLFSIFFVCFLSSQNEELFKASTIPYNLLNHSNAVVRLDKTTLEVKSYDQVIVHIKRIVTIINENGISKSEAAVGYDDNRIIKGLEARIYNSNGEEIKKIKKNDFQDVSAVDGGTLYSDSRIKYLEYTPIAYPYTIEFEAELDFRSTAFLPSWTPLSGYYASTETSEFEIINESDVEVRLKPDNFRKFPIEVLSDYHYMANAIEAITPESFSPDLDTFKPELKVLLNTFSMEGVKGMNNNWKEFGKWYNDELLAGTDILPDQVKTDIKALTKDISDPIEKAKIVYKFMQDKTRYISVQIGIGGWKPFNAEDVDRLGYSDCKGLSNYTKALLKEVGVDSHFVVLYGSSEIKSMEKDFSSPAANHAILAIPHNDDYIWLECTSQTNPFGFIAGFTDDRDVLVITPEGGKIVHTKVYETNENLQRTTAVLKLDKAGNIQADVTIKTYGYQYALHRDIQFMEDKDQRLRYKRYWNNINNLSLGGIDLNDDKNDICFTENINLSADNYATLSGNLVLFEVNSFNKFETIPTRYNKRSHDFEIDRGFVDEDAFKIELSEGLTVEALPNTIEIENEFGVYKSSIEQIDEKTLEYKRTFVLNKGYYPKEKYSEFRSFLASVVKNDTSKMALKSN